MHGSAWPTSIRRSKPRAECLGVRPQRTQCERQKREVQGSRYRKVYRCLQVARRRRRRSDRGTDDHCACLGSTGCEVRSHRATRTGRPGPGSERRYLSRRLIEPARSGQRPQTLDVSAATTRLGGMGRAFAGSGPVLAHEAQATRSATRSADVRVCSLAIPRSHASTVVRGHGSDVNRAVVKTSASASSGSWQASGTDARNPRTGAAWRS
ncbi:MAG: hypothetical protein QOJ29_2612 [Thermoleophilaceae bacterium]|nr:hypothetical protein [Thermoleophilaceae bacterium]